MAVPAPSVVDRLLLARFELEGGRAELASNTEPGAFKAIKTFHDALETFFVALADHLWLQGADGVEAHNELDPIPWTV